MNDRLWNEHYETSFSTDENDVSLADYSRRVLALYGVEEFLHDSVSTFNTQLAPNADIDLPEIDITHLASWYYQEGKTVEWIEGGRPKVPYIM